MQSLRVSWRDEAGLTETVREIWLLLVLGLRLWWSKLRRSSWRYRLGWIVLAVVVAGGALAAEAAESMVNR